MKEILTFSKAGITAPTTLFTAGPDGLLFTAVNAPGLTLIANLAKGGSIALPSNPVGAGLGYGDSLSVSGSGSILITMWGTLDEPFKVTGTTLEVLVATSITFAKAGTVGSVSFAANQAKVIKPGTYTDKAYIINTTTRVVSWA